MATRRIQEAIGELGGKATPREIYHKLLAMGYNIKENAVQVACLRASHRGETWGVCCEALQIYSAKDGPRL